MKKVFFLLFAVLCLVSCRTAVVEESPELETLVPVVEGPSSSNPSLDAASDVTSDVASDVLSVESYGTSQVPVLEPQLDVENEITDNLDASSENPSLEDNLEASITEEPSDELEPIPVEQNDSASSDDMGSPMDSVGSIEEPSLGSSLDVVEETSPSEESLTAGENPIDEVSEPSAIEETKGFEASVSVPQNVQPNNQVPPAVQPKASVEPKVEDGSFMDRLTAFVLREKLFCFGVLTVFIGIVMLVVVMIRDLVRAGRRNSKNYKPVQDADGIEDEPNPSVSSIATNGHDDHDEKHENSAIDDDDEFLRSLLNS